MLVVFFFSSAFDFIWRAKRSPVQDKMCIWNALDREDVFLIVHAE